MREKDSNRTSLELYAMLTEDEQLIHQCRTVIDLYEKTLVDDSDINRALLGIEFDNMMDNLTRLTTIPEERKSSLLSFFVRGYVQVHKLISGFTDEREDFTSPDTN